MDKTRNATDIFHALATEQPKPTVDIPYTKSEYPQQKTASFESQSATAEADEVAIAPNMDWHQVKKAEELVRKSGGQGLSHLQQMEMLKYYPPNF